MINYEAITIAEYRALMEGAKRHLTDDPIGATVRPSDDPLTAVDRDAPTAQPRAHRKAAA